MLIDGTRAVIGSLALTIDIAPHRRNRPRCSGCGASGRVYDRLTPRRFEFVPLWGLRVFFLYAMRRVVVSVKWWKSVSAS